MFFFSVIGAIQIRDDDDDDDDDESLSNRPQGKQEPVCTESAVNHQSAS